jgi:Ser-tRNA(Ala) deacylase AlaX
MTIKLYYEDHYLNEFEARVVCIENKFVELDQTAFYGEGGGQSGDIGTLNNEKVMSTIFLDDDRHVHVMEKEPSFKVGDTVHGLIDWDRRYRIMRLHTASHLMEYFLWNHFGYMKRTGSNVDDRKDRADYLHSKRLDPETLKKVEEDTNMFIAEDHPVTITVDNEGVRTWRCGPVEMLCAGTHVKNTREIGSIKLKRKNPGRGQERVETSLGE